MSQDDHAAELDEVCDEEVDDVYRSDVVLSYLQENSSGSTRRLLSNAMMFCPKVHDHSDPRIKQACGYV